MGTCKFLALCECQGLCCLFLPFGSCLSLASFLRHLRRSVYSASADLCTFFSLQLPPFSYFALHILATLASPHSQLCLFNSLKLLNTFRFFLPPLWPGDSFRGLAGALVGLTAFLPLFSRVTALCCLLLNVCYPTFIYKETRLTAGKTVHLAPLRSKRQNQDLNSLLYDTKTHIVIDSVINRFISLFWLQLTSLFCPWHFGCISPMCFHFLPHYSYLCMYLISPSRLWTL